MLSGADPGILSRGGGGRVIAKFSKFYNRKKRDLAQNKGGGTHAPKSVTGYHNSYYTSNYVCHLNW